MPRVSILLPGDAHTDDSVILVPDRIVGREGLSLARLNPRYLRHLLKIPPTTVGTTADSWDVYRWH